MKILKKCLTCGAEFIASKMSNKYCCRECERDASRKREAKRKKSVRESEKEAALDKERDAVASRPFLTPSDVALLLDMSVSTVYRCFYSGIIKAVRIRRKTLVRREDLDKYFEDAGPYRKRSYKRKQEQEYYTLQEIMDKYKIGRKAVWGRCDRLGIPKVYEGRNTFYSKKLIDANFSELLDVIDIDNYYTLSQIMEMYNMTQGAALCFVKYHAVPRVKRNGRSYYSKVHIDCIKHKTDEIDPDWYSYEEAMQKYGITKDQVSYTLKTYSIKTEKRGKFTMIYRTDFDNIMHQRLQNSTPLIKSNGEEKVVFTAKQQEKICPATPEGYYSTDEVAEMFKISIKHAGVITRENNIPKIALKGFNFYEKGSIDLLYNKKNKYAEITDWITPEEMRTTFKMTADGVRSFIHRHKIPAKVEYGSTYYSKQHIEEIKNGYFVGRDRYYSVEEATKKYNLTNSLVFYYVNHYKLTRVKKQKFIFFRKEEFDRLMEKRFSEDDLKTNNMQYCKSVTLRMRDRRNGTKSLFLDFWPGYRNPETMELIRRRSLGMYIYANPISTQQKKYNETILAKAEAIRCKVFIEVINEKYDLFNQDRLKEDFLAYFKNIVNRNFAKCDAAYKHFSRFCHNKCTFEMLDTVFCNKYKEYLLDTKVSARGKVMVNKPISRNTASAYWNIFKQVLTKAYRERRLVDNIASLLDNIPCTIPVKQSLSLEEVRKLYNSECSVPVVRKAAIFSCLSGLRISDILNLKWENIQTYADGGHYLDFKCVKTQRQTQVPIGDDAYELIQPQTTDKYIFSGFNRTMTYRVMQDWIKECGINKHITFHCFRHTYASLQLELGTDIYTVQHLLNHKNVSTTQIYASHADPKTREAADRIRLTNVKMEMQENENINVNAETKRKKEKGKSKK